MSTICIKDNNLNISSLSEKRKPNQCTVWLYAPIFKVGDTTAIFLRLVSRGSMIVSCEGQMAFYVGNSPTSIGSTPYGAGNPLTLNANQQKYLRADSTELGLVFDDVSQLKAFDAQVNYPGIHTHSFSADVDASDIFKLRFVEDLAIASSIRHPECLDPDVFLRFNNLLSLQVGAAVTDYNPYELGYIKKDKCLRTIHLSDEVVSRLAVINLDVYHLPPNFHLLTSCTHIYLNYGSSWAFLRDKPFNSSQRRLSVWNLLNCDTGDELAIQSFISHYAVNPQATGTEHFVSYRII